MRGGEKLKDITVGKYKYVSVILNKYSASIYTTVSMLLFVCNWSTRLAAKVKSKNNSEVIEV